MGDSDRNPGCPTLVDVFRRQGGFRNSHHLTVLSPGPRVPHICSTLADVGPLPPSSEIPTSRIPGCPISARFWQMWDFGCPIQARFWLEWDSTNLKLKYRIAGAPYLPDVGRWVIPPPLFESARRSPVPIRLPTESGPQPLNEISGCPISARFWQMWDSPARSGSCAARRR